MAEAENFSSLQAAIDYYEDWLFEAVENEDIEMERQCRKIIDDLKADIDG